MFLKKIYKFKLYLILFTLCSCGSISDSFKSHIDGEYIPKNLNDAISELDKNISDSSKILIKKMYEEDFLSESHFGDGMVIRNNWNLWGKSRLKSYFKIKGVSHPDDMSSIILKSYYRKINNQEIRLNEQIKYYKKYWKTANKEERLLSLPKEEKHPERNLEFGYAMYYTNNGNTEIIHMQTNSVIDCYWIYDYYYGWAKIDNQTKELLQNSRSIETEKLMNQIFNK